MNEAQEVCLNWWKLNQAAFEAEDYARVVPLDTDLKVEIPQASPLVEKAIEEAVSFESEVNEPSEVALIEIAEEAPEESTNWLLWLIGALAVLGGLVVLRWGLIWFGAVLLLRPVRECPACFQPTVSVRRPVLAGLLGNAEWRWCPTCAWQGPASKLKDDRWIPRSVKSRD